MRLLNSRTLQLKEFVDISTSPPYATLSHTWEEGEVSFQQIQDLDSCEGMKGFEKIKGCWAKAVQDDLGWVWIDTCCIDKSSSAELSKAINSMFLWYRESLVCYAYLSDVSSTHGRLIREFPQDAIPLPMRPRSLKAKSKRCPEGVHQAVWAQYCHNCLETHVTEGLSRDQTYAKYGDEEGERLLPEYFAHSRWFTRGWTLQELIAPRVVEFYSADWTEIGTKSSLIEVLQQGTRVRRQVLEGTVSPKGIPAAECLSWISVRTTTRTEDMAYSLLGLLDINMPLLYGEGEKALLRLQEQIINAKSDWSVLLWSCSWPDPEIYESFLTLWPGNFRFLELKTKGIRSAPNRVVIEDWSILRPQSQSIAYESTKDSLHATTRQLKIGLPIISSSYRTAHECNVEDVLIWTLFELSPVCNPREEVSKQLSFGVCLWGSQRGVGHGVISKKGMCLAHIADDLVSSRINLTMVTLRLKPEPTYHGSGRQRLGRGMENTMLRGSDPSRRTARVSLARQAAEGWNVVLRGWYRPDSSISAIWEPNAMMFENRWNRLPVEVDLLSTIPHQRNQCCGVFSNGCQRRTSSAIILGLSCRPTKAQLRAICLVLRRRTCCSYRTLTSRSLCSARSRAKTAVGLN